MAPTITRTSVDLSPLKSYGIHMNCFTVNDQDINKWNEFGNGTLIKLIGAQWRHMALEILVNTGSGNGLLPDGTKPLPEPMLAYHQ